MKKILLLCLSVYCYLQSYGAAQEEIPVIDFANQHPLVPLRADQPIVTTIFDFPHHLIQQRFAGKAAEAQARGASGLHAYLTEGLWVNSFDTGLYDVYLSVSLAKAPRQDQAPQVTNSLRETFLMRGESQIVRFTDKVLVRHFPIFSTDSFRMEFPELDSWMDQYVAEVLFERRESLSMDAVADRLVEKMNHIETGLQAIQRMR